MSRGGDRRRDSALLEQGSTDHYQDATLYDFEYRDRQDDIRWYQARTRALALDRRDGPVLELGAGTGRVTLPLSEDGHQIIALDAVEPMLDALRRKLQERKIPASRVQIRHGDFRTLPLEDRSTPLVIAPFNALMHLYTWNDLLCCFREVYRVLQPAGVLAFDVQNPDLEWLTWDPEVRHSVTYFDHPRSGERTVYSTNHTYDASSQVCHIRIFYDRAPPRGVAFDPDHPPPSPLQLVHLAHRQIFPEEVRALLDRAGFVDVRVTGDFTNRSLRADHESQSVVARKPA